MTQLLNIAKSFSGLFFTVLAFVALYMAVRFILNKQSKGLAEGNLIRQVILMTIVVIGIIAVMLALPMPDDIRANIMSLLGIVLSAIFALSSVSFMGNMLAGFMLRTINNFRSGDFIEVESYFGRVSERGLFHTELQTIDRSLITLPNLFLATNPVKVTRSSGTFISGECSLGYDVSHEKIEAALIKAAKAAGLQDPFVHVTTLGDFSVVYKVHGLLKDVKRILTAKSNLYKMILDCLHEADIEIVSPNFMNQRQVGDAVFIPKKELKKIPEKKQTQSPEDLIFDKADQAENLEFKKKRLTELEPKLEELDEQLKTAETEEAKAAVQGKIDQLVSLRERMQKSIEEEVSKLDKRSK